MKDEQEIFFGVLSIYRIMILRIANHHRTIPTRKRGQIRLHNWDMYILNDEIGNSKHKLTLPVLSGQLSISFVSVSPFAAISSIRRTRSSTSPTMQTSRKRASSSSSTYSSSSSSSKVDWGNITKVLSRSRTSKISDENR